MVIHRIDEPLVGYDERHRVQQKAAEGRQAVKTEPLCILSSKGDHIDAHTELD